MKGSNCGARKRAVIFDLDGTLIDSMPLVIEMFRFAVEPFRERPTPSEVVAQLGGPPDTCVAKLLGSAAIGSLSAAVDRMLNYEKDHLQDVRRFGGSRDLLVSLRAKGVKLGIWTGRDRSSTERMLRALGFGDCFDVLVCGDDLASHKPDPEGLLRAIDALGVTAEDAIFVGDADVDVRGGCAAGIHTILIHHGRGADADVHSRATEVFAEPGEAFAAIARHFP
jgi:pyrophosphatase PpaX